MMPSLSVIMPVYNSARYLREAIDSILTQTFVDFELIILNDGSTDNSKDIILSYTDPRIIFIDNENTGLPAIQNKGLNLARGKYIARMDSDDIAMPNRLKRQFEFMESNPDIAVCGSFFEFIGYKDTLRNFNWVTQTHPELVKINLLFDCAVCQPTVLMRASVLRENNISYNDDFEVSEDYELWVNISKNFKIANIPDVLLQYRISDIQVSGKRNEMQVANKFRLIKAQLQALGIEPDNAELRIHFYMFFPAVILSYDYLPKVKQWISKLIDANKKYAIYDKDLLSAYLNDLLKLNVDAFNRAISKATFKQRLAHIVKTALRWNSIR